MAITTPTTSYNDILKAFGNGGLTLQQAGSAVPQGPSRPGYVQGTANTVPRPATSQGVLGASTYSGGGGVTGGGGGRATSPGALDSITNNTKSQYQLQLDQANNLYDSQAGSLRDQLGSLDRQKGNVLDQIGATYGGLVQTAKDTLTKNVGLLHGREGEVGQQYDTQRQSTAQLLGDQERKNRIYARGAGLLGSSFYVNDLQGAAGRQATQRIGGLNTEEQSKLDAIGTAITNANTDTNTKIEQLGKEEANARNDIVSKYIDQANAVQNALNFNGRDKITALSGINGQMQNALNAISQTFASYAQYTQSLPQVAQQFTSSLQTDPFAAIQPTLSNQQAYNGALGSFGVLPTNQGAAPDANAILGYLGQNGQRKQNYLDFLG